eukprot:NODE_807_length_3783_cov_0.538002.p8 type:complete len:133 gc:universal NODE_807_length_3783_cov_0.538002:1616-2014(+)
MDLHSNKPINLVKHTRLVIKHTRLVKCIKVLNMDNRVKWLKVHIQNHLQLKKYKRNWEWDTIINNRDIQMIKFTINKVIKLVNSQDNKDMFKMINTIKLMDNLDNRVNIWDNLVNRDIVIKINMEINPWVKK